MFSSQRQYLAFGEYQKKAGDKLCAVEENEELIH